jgi:hypothetical protein
MMQVWLFFKATFPLESVNLEQYKDEAYLESRRNGGSVELLSDALNLLRNGVSQPEVRQ